MSDLTIYTCEQNTPEWLDARRGIPTASEFSTLLAQGRTQGAPSVTRRRCMLKTIGEQMGATPVDSYSNAAMERGHAMEQEAADLYTMVTGNVCETVGFMRRTLDGGDAGCSPDRLVGEDGMVEIKTAEPHIQLERILSAELPSEHAAQVHGQLWISGRAWCDVVSYWPGLPIFIHRVHRSDEWCARLAVAVREFHEDLAQLTAEILAKS